MKTENKKIWNGEPWDENTVSNLPRPSAEVRNNVYAIAREQVANSQQHSRPAFQQIKMIFRGRYSYAVWSAAASLLIATCVWLGTTDRGSYVNYQSSNDLNNMVNEAVAILNEQDFSPFTEHSGVDIDEAVFIVEAQTVNEEIASLKNNLQLSYMF